TLAQSASQLQAAARHLVEAERIGLAVRSQADDMPERRFLGLLQISHQGARGLDLQGAVVNAEAVERGRAKLLVEGLARLLGLEVPRGADRDGQCRRGPQRTQPG